MTETVPTNLNVDLTDEKLDALDDFLASPALEYTAMDVSALEGFLAALAIGRRAPDPKGLTTSSFSFGRGPRQRVVRSAPKGGRNELCPCGSGKKKYKKCCGDGNSTVH